MLKSDLMKKLILLVALFSITALFAQPAINQQVSPYYNCSTGAAAIYQLETKIPEILNGIDPATVTVTFHFSQSNAIAGINPISSPFTATGNQTIFVRVSFVGNPSSYSLTSFMLVNSQPPAVTFQNYSVCNTLTGNFPLVDLWMVAEQIWNSSGLTANDFGIAFFETEADAFSNINQLSSPYAVFSQTSQIIYATCTTYGSGCTTIIPVQLNIVNCLSGGQPVDLATCTELETACFDLSPNVANVLGNLEPSSHIVTFFTSFSDANAGINPIENFTDFCVPVTPQNYTVYVRLLNTSNNSSEVLTFSLIFQSVVTGNTQLDPLIGCDDNADGTVVFDLTAIAAQLNTTNTLLFYNDYANAANNVNAILNPEAYSVTVSSNSIWRYIREVVPGNCDLIHWLQLLPLANCNLSSVCSGANTLCSSLNVAFPNTVNIPSSGAAACLGTTPNPTWFFIPVSQSGSLAFQISQITTVGTQSDVDYICYGPFDNPMAACSNSLTANFVVGCSYSAASVETLNIQNALAGKYYVLMVTNFGNQQGTITINLMGGTGEIDCSGLKFTAFVDNNENGIKDSNEVNFPLGNFNYVRNDDGITHNISAPNGSYTLYDINETNSYDVTFEVNQEYAANYAVTSSGYSNLSVATSGGVTEYFFPVLSVAAYNDLSVSIIPVAAPQPGFLYTTRIMVHNVSAQAVTNAQLVFTVDAALTIANISPSGAVITPEGFTYTIGNLAPFGMVEIIVTMNVPVIPTINLGDVVTNSAAIIGATDYTPENNQVVCSQVVIGSYDPNDKMESRGARILIDDFTTEDYLYYTIRFENTGTAPALNVRINDVLHDSLDPESIRMIASSHPYILDRVGAVLNWRFENILLPFTAQDPQGSQGFVHFKVKPFPGFSVGDIIPNTASIYFDFNPPIITNTFLSEFVNQLSVEDNFLDGFVVYPNPASTQLNIASQQGQLIQEVVLYDLAGKCIFREQVLTEHPTINLLMMAKGLYLLEITDTSGLKAIRKIVIQ